MQQPFNSDSRGSVEYHFPLELMSNVLQLTQLQTHGLQERDRGSDNQCQLGIPEGKGSNIA